MIEYYSPYAINTILENFKPSWVKKDGNFIMNEAISFDIETSSIRLDNQKYAFMYVWMLDINDKTIIGRTWQEFVTVMNTISSYYNLQNIKKRCVIYIHNLSYEFQFIRKWLKWIKVFSLAKRKPLYAVSDTGIEFRCSYRLSGYSLDKIGEQVGIEKLKNDFDYRLVRHYKTTLTKDELRYCIHDVKIVTKYIKRKIKEENNNISEIPLTKTGYVRRYVRNNTLRGKNRSFYKNAIKELTLEPEEYMMAKKAFAGGFTHASVLHAGKELSNVWSKDFSSSYPSVMIAEKYPMTKGRRITHIKQTDFLKLMHDDTKASIFSIELTDVEQIFPAESYISLSRCRSYENVVTNNGRVSHADRLIIDITNIDFCLIERCYTFNISRIGHLYVYKTFYLPTSFIECILHFYEAKTTLKGVPDKVIEYMNGKENLNSLYGMTVTDIVRDLYEYDNKGGWLETQEMSDEEYKEEVSKQVDKENNKKSRFLYYLWGVFVTAYARRNLWSGIFELKSDYVYADTDSVKYINHEKHENYFLHYNEKMTRKLEAAMEYHNLSAELLRPKNIKGEEKPLGIWEQDGVYDRFKAVRAKAYMYTANGHYGMTVAGLKKYDPYDPNKYDPETNPNGNRTAIDYLLTIGDPLKEFHIGMVIPPEYTGKLTHTFIDDSFSITVEDHNKCTARVFEKSAIHLEPAEYNMNEAKAIRDVLAGYQLNVYD